MLVSSALSDEELMQPSAHAVALSALELALEARYFPPPETDMTII